MLHLAKSQSKLQSTGQNIYEAEKKSMCLKHKVLLQNNKPEQEHVYGKNGKRTQTSQFTIKFKWPAHYREINAQPEKQGCNLKEMTFDITSG